jgi:hypothetical protein
MARPALGQSGPGMSVLAHQLPARLAVRYQRGDMRGRCACACRLEAIRGYANVGIAADRGRCECGPGSGIMSTRAQFVRGRHQAPEQFDMTGRIVALAFQEPSRRHIPIRPAFPDGQDMGETIGALVVVIHALRIVRAGLQVDHRHFWCRVLACVLTSDQPQGWLSSLVGESLAD